jgi:hypothetical protein
MEGMVEFRPTALLNAARSQTSIEEVMRVMPPDRSEFEQPREALAHSASHAGH